MNAPRPASGPDPPVPYETLVRDLFSLEPRDVIARGLEIIRAVSGADRCLLVGHGRAERHEALLTPIDDPDLRVSRSAIAEAFETGRTVARFATPDGRPFEGSAAALALRRIWVHPLRGPDGNVLAALYTDSSMAGTPFPPELEARLEAVAEHVGLSLRNAVLHAALRDANERLEARVAERTRELEVSQAQLIAQDRLVTLGRLVAGIAHELNNPAGALTSFASRLAGALRAGLAFEGGLRRRVPDPERAEAVRVLLAEVVERAAGPAAAREARDSREAGLRDWLRGNAPRAAERVAERLARLALPPASLAPVTELLDRDADWLLDELERTHHVGRGLAGIESSAATIGRIVRGLKTYAHLDQSAVEVADIHRSLDATVALLGPRLGERIVLEQSYASIPPFAHRPGELTQVWTNLLDNALHAVAEGGRITIRTAHEGGEAVVRIRDDGPGVPEELRGRIFELHSTSRGPGTGLGLGLPICRSIVVEHHQGRIGFSSRLGCTEFEVRLPMRAGP